MGSEWAAGRGLSGRLRLDLVPAVRTPAPLRLWPPPPDGPSFAERSCPSNWTWVEGSEQLFSCEVEGKPQPSVQCVGSEGASEGLLLPLAPLNPSASVPSVPRDLAPGIYVCNATNPHGSAVKTVVVSAECERGPGGRGSRRSPGAPAPP